MHKEASSSDRHPAVVQGQEDLTGVKSVQIKRTLKKNSDEEYVIAQSVRTEMLYNTIDEAKDAYINIKDAMEEVDFEEATEEKPMEDSETHAAAINADKLTTTAAVPDDFNRDQLSGDPRYFRSLKHKHVDELPKELCLREKQLAVICEKILDYQSDHIGSNLNSKDWNNDEFDNLVDQAKSLIQDCKKIITYCMDWPKYRDLCNTIYDKLREHASFLTLCDTYRQMMNKEKKPSLYVDDNLEFSRAVDDPDYVYKPTKVEYYPDNGAFEILDENSNSENSTTAEASYAFGMSVLANQETLGFEAILDEKTPIPTNVDQPLKEHDVEQYTGPAGYATMVQPSPGANSMVGKDPHTAAYQSQLEPNFPVSTMEHELTLGVNRELEHVSDPAKALEIAIDHLAEDKNYYTKLNTVLPEYGPEEKPERTVEISENPSAHELADKHNYEDTYKAFTEEMLGHDK